MTQQKQVKFVTSLAMLQFRPRNELIASLTPIGCLHVKLWHDLLLVSFVIILSLKFINTALLKDTIVFVCRKGCITQNIISIKHFQRDRERLSEDDLVLDKIVMYRILQIVTVYVECLGLKSRRNSLSCTVKTSRQMVCNQRVGAVQWRVV